MFGVEHARGIRLIVIAVLSGWLVSWLGVAACVPERRWRRVPVRLLDVPEE
jgi:hypothetical protein